MKWFQVQFIWYWLTLILKLTLDMIILFSNIPLRRLIDTNCWIANRNRAGNRTTSGIICFTLTRCGVPIQRRWRSNRKQWKPTVSPHLLIIPNISPKNHTTRTASSFFQNRLRASPTPPSSCVPVTIIAVTSLMTTNQQFFQILGYLNLLILFIAIYWVMLPIVLVLEDSFAIAYILGAKSYLHLSICWLALYFRLTKSYLMILLRFSTARSVVNALIGSLGSFPFPEFWDSRSFWESFGVTGSSIWVFRYSDLFSALRCSLPMILGITSETSYACFLFKLNCCSRMWVEFWSSQCSLHPHVPRASAQRIPVFHQAIQRHFPSTHGRKYS